MTRSLAIDTSALIALIRNEPDAPWFASVLDSAGERLLSAGSLQELLVVHADHARRAELDVDLAHAIGVATIAALDITVVPVSAELATIGAAAVLRYRQAPARLNLGDGFAYALAKSYGVPLLCKGNDFPHTDIEVLQPPAA